MNMIRLIAASLVVMLMTGCSTLVTYQPKDNGQQQLRYVQGVGSATVADTQSELFMYPTFKLQSGSSIPTFTLGYANHSIQPVTFSPDNIRAYFNNQPVPLYTYEDRVSEIRNEKIGKQVALAILGGIAAYQGAKAASHQTYTTSVQGAVWNRRGVTSFSGMSTTRVYDPMAGIAVGATVGAFTGIGLQQIEYNAQNEEMAANNMLQTTTVDPLYSTQGEVLLHKLDPFSKDSVLRFEVTIAGKVSVFEFNRKSIQ